MTTFVADKLMFLANRCACVSMRERERGREREREREGKREFQSFHSKYFSIISRKMKK